MTEDKRSKKIALVSHCVLNQNAVIGGGAGYPTVIPYVLEALQAHNFAIMQMPCPEMSSAGLNRWGQVKEQYLSSGFKRSFQRLAEYTLDSVEDYVSNGYKIIIIGIEGSPSCGIEKTESNPDWGGETVCSAAQEVKLINDRGVFIELLNREALLRGWPAFPAFGIPGDSCETADSQNKLHEFLSKYD